MRRACLLVALLFSANCTESLGPFNPARMSGLVGADPDYFRDTDLRYWGRLVVDDDMEWAETWTRLSPNDAPLPVVDFDKDVIVIASLGSGPGGRSISLSRADHAANGDIVVRVRESRGTGLHIDRRYHLSGGGREGRAAERVDQVRGARRHYGLHPLTPGVRTN